MCHPARFANASTEIYHWIAQPDVVPSGTLREHEQVLVVCHKDFDGPGEFVLSTLRAGMKAKVLTTYLSSNQFHELLVQFHLCKWSGQLTNFMHECILFVCNLTHPLNSVFASNFALAF
jgi:hypothetical protein